MLAALAVFFAVSTLACALRMYESHRDPRLTRRGEWIMEALLWIGLPAAVLAAVVLAVLAAFWWFFTRVRPAN